MVSPQLRVGFFEVLDREGGNVSVAARSVGVNLNTAFWWVRKAGLRGRGSTSNGGHPGRAEYGRLRAGGVHRKEAARRVGVNVRTAQDWDHGVRSVGRTRIYPDGRRVDYRTGLTTMVTASVTASVTA